MSKKEYELFFEITKIGNRAVRKAQAENRKLGIPNVYSRKNRPYWELPDGTLTMVPPQLFRTP